MIFSLRLPSFNRPSREDLFFSALIALHLVPVWAFRFIPTQDGFAHLCTADVLRLYYRPEGELFRKYFEFTKDLDPYWTVNLLLAWLQDLASPLMAEKLLVTLYAVLFPLSVRYLAGSIDPRQSYLSWLAFPLMMGFWFHTGFYNYCLGLALYCFILGYWLRMDTRTGPVKLLILGALSVVLYFTHPVPSLLLALSLLVLTIWFTACDFAAAAKGRMPADQANENCMIRWLETPLAFLPFLILLSKFTLRILTYPIRPILPAAKAGDSWGLLLGLDYLTSFQGVEIYVMRAVFVLCLCLMTFTVISKLASRQWTRNDGLLLLFTIILILYFFMPQYELMNKRLLIFLPLTAIPWLASVSFGTRASRAVRVAAFLLSAVWAVNLTVQYRHWNRYLEEGAGLMERVEGNRTLLYLNYVEKWPAPQENRIRFNPLRHLGNYFAAEKDLVSLNNYEAYEAYRPLQYRYSLNPYEIIGYPEEQSLLNLQSYADFGGSIDYVMMWVSLRANVRQALSENLEPQLQNGFDLIETSAGGHAQLYRRKGLA